MIRKLLALLLLAPCIALSQPTPGTWSAGNNFVNDAAFDAASVTIDANSGTTRGFIITIQTGSVVGFATSTFTVGGQAPSGFDTQTATTGESMVNYVACWTEAALDAMSGSDVAYDDNQDDDLVVSYVTLQNADQTDIDDCTFLDEDQISAGANHALVTTSDATDYIIAIAEREVAEGSSQYDTWDTLTELWDETDGSGSHAAGAAGDGTDDTTTIELEGAETDDGIAASLVISEAAAPVFTVGPTEAAAANGHTISGTITCAGTCTVYAAAWPPAASAPADCDAVQAASGALFAASEVWATGVGDSFALTEDNNPPRTDVYVCGSDGTTDTAVTSLTDQDRSPDSGKSIVALTSVAATSPFTLQTVAGCDTTDTSSTVTGCTDTSWLDVGMLVDLSAGFADLTDALVTAVTATTITFDRAANATSSNITVTQDTYYSATVVTGDVVEYTRSTSTGFEAIFAADGTLTVDEYSDTHDGSNDAAALSDSGESWVTSEHIGATVQNTTDGSSCVITANTATTVTCTLAGGTQNDWDTNDVYVIFPVAALSAYQVVSYCIEDVSDATDATFTTPNCWTTPDSMYLFDVVPEWGDLGQFPVLLYQDEAMTEIDLATVCTHVNGHTLTFIVDSGTVPNGTTIASDGSWTGTPDTEDENGETLNLRCKNQGGLTVEADISSYVTDDEIVAPQCVGDTVNTCLSDLDTVRGWAESGEQLTATFQCSSEANEDLILSQDPVAMGTLAAEDDPLVVVVGLGACGATNPGNRGSQLRGVQLGL